MIPDEPQQSLSGGVLPRLQFVQDKSLESLRLGGRLPFPVADFLWGQLELLTAPALARGSGGVGRTLMLPSRSFLTGRKALEPRRSRTQRRVSPCLEKQSGNATPHTEQSRQVLGGVEELGGRNGIVVGGIDGDLREGLDVVEPRSTGRDSSRHDCRKEEVTED